MKTKKMFPRFEVGVLLCMFGTQYSRVIMETLSLSINITNIIFAIGLLLIPNYSRLLSFKGLRIKKGLALIFVYQFVVLFYGFIAGASLFEGGEALIFTFFVLVFLLLLNSRQGQEFDSDRFLSIGWWSSGVFSFLLCLVATDFFRNFNRIGYLKMGSDRLTLSVIAFAYLIFTLVYVKDKPYKIVLSVIFTIAAVISVIVCTRKGMLVSYIVIIAIYFFRKFKNKITAKAILRTIGVVAVLIIGFRIASKMFPSISESLENYLSLFNSSINGFLGRESGLYNTGEIRNNLLRELWSDYTRNYSIIEYILGKGYYYNAIDFPYLRAFTEMGIIGGLLYTVVELITPIKQIAFRSTDTGLTFFQYYALVVLAQNIYSGGPYGHYKFIPIIMLAWVYGNVFHKTSARYEGKYENIAG